MTAPLSLPQNLDPTCISCGETAALTAQLNAGIAAGVATAQGAIAGQTAQLQALVAQANASSAAVFTLIDLAFSQEVINGLLAKFIGPNGIPDLQCVRDELLKLHDVVNKTNDVLINSQQVPELPDEVLAIVESLVPPIPTLTIPSPGEIKEYIMMKLEELERQRQDAISKLQNEKAKALEDAPTFV